MLFEEPFTARRHRQNRPVKQRPVLASTTKGATTVPILITTDYPVPGDDNEAAAMP